MLKDMIVFFVNHKVLLLLQPIASMSSYNGNLID